MASTSRSAMAAYTFLVFFLLSLVSAQSISPSNGSLPIPVDTLVVIYGVNGGAQTTVVVAPLTVGIGMGQNQISLNAIKIQAPIRAADASSISSVPSGDIIYISCDSNAATSNISPDQVLQLASAVRPPAIILYSLTSGHCNLNGVGTYMSILTMTSASDSVLFKKALDNNGNVGASIVDGTNANATNNNLVSTNAPSAPTTAVAMSILYSITGIITILFLVIIATGAWRAHRHPERYGPRGGFPGRPRQSRAKGLGRAILETLPIVKFGDPDPPKHGQDIELENGTAHELPAAAVVREAAETKETPNIAQASTAAVPAEVHDHEHEQHEEHEEHGKSPEGDGAIGPDTQDKGVHAKDDELGNELGCSICTEDFVKGEDVRVLPCNHKYHPPCIDPWLLNVSGTCPLCRVDLRPVAPNTEAEGAATAETAEGTPVPVEGELPPPLTESEAAGQAIRPRRRSRVLDVGYLRRLPVNERIGALRQLRAEERERTGEAASGERVGESSRRASITQGVRSAFRLRPRGEAPIAEGSAAPTAAPTVGAPAEEAGSTSEEERQERLRQQRVARRLANIVAERRPSTFII